MALDTIADRYAEAYFAQARDDGRLADALGELQQLRQVVLETPRVNEFLTNPEIDPAEKRAVLQRAFGPAMSEQTLHLVDLLIANDRGTHLVAVAEAFEARWLAAQGVQRAVIHSARALSPALVTRIRRRIEALTRARIEVETAVEPALLGGVRIQIDHREFDGSLRRRLSELKDTWSAAPASGA